MRGGDGSRREFFARLRVLAPDCVLRERSLAVCVVHLDGIGEIGRIIDYSVSRQVNAALLHRLSADAAASCAGRLSESLLAIAVSGFPDREALTAQVHSAFKLAREISEWLLRWFGDPIRVTENEFFLRPTIGVAIYPEHGADAETLLMHAAMARYRA